MEVGWSEEVETGGWWSAEVVDGSVMGGRSERDGGAKAGSIKSATDGM